MDFELYVRHDTVSDTMYWFKYIVIYDSHKLNVNEKYMSLWRYSEAMKLVDIVDMPEAGEFRSAMQNGYRVANSAETAKFLLLAKNNGSENRSR